MSLHARISTVVDQKSVYSVAVGTMRWPVLLDISYVKQPLNSEGTHDHCAPCRPVGYRVDLGVLK